MAQAIRDELIEELLQGYSSPQDLLGEGGLFKELKKRLLERALGAELSEHLGYEKGDPAGRSFGTQASAVCEGRRPGASGPNPQAVADLVT
jgi:transposase-like protein